jgi:hypothetical protein
MAKAMPAFADQSTWLEGAFHPSTSIKIALNIESPGGAKNKRAVYGFDCRKSTPTEQIRGPGDHNITILAWDIFAL